MRPTLPALLLLLVCPTVGASPLQDVRLRNGDVEAEAAGKPEAWIPTASVPGAEFARAADAGSARNHVLAIVKADPLDRTAHNWFQKVELGAAKPGRLELRARLRGDGLGVTSECALMVEVWSAKQCVGAAWSEKQRAPTAWREVSTVFAVPAEADSLIVRAYLVGAGSVAFDDFALAGTTKALKSDSSSGPSSPYEALARRAACEIPWELDVEVARRRAAEERKPILVYVRCIDADAELAAAQRDLAMQSVQFSDDGLRKDVLLRAGPLSDPDVQELVRRRFVPLILTYDLSLHGMGPATPDPLAGVGLEACRTVTPALAVVEAKGPREGEPRLLHRIGVLSAHFVDQWLRAALAERRQPYRGEGDARELLAAGEVAAAAKLLAGDKSHAGRALLARARRRLGDLDGAWQALGASRDPDACVERGWILLARGEVDAAADELELELETAHPRSAEARYARAVCLRELGRHAESAALLVALAERAEETPYGRKAAARLLGDGPELALAETWRVLPGGAGLPSQTEGLADAAAWQPARAIEFLLAAQQESGAFGSHDGERGARQFDATITVLAAEALEAWKPKLDGKQGARIERALVAAHRAVEAWSRGDSDPGFDAFNAPYVLEWAVARKDASLAREAIRRVAEAQRPDGNWSIYGPERPASFNTALAVLALARARSAGIDVPPEVLASGVAALESMRTSSGLFPYSTKAGHEWMTTPHGSIARDALCEHALLAAGKRTKPAIEQALERFLQHHGELRAPTKKLYDYFDERAHGGYYFFFAYHNAVRAAEHGSPALRKKLFAATRGALEDAREFDGTWIDHAMLGRGYATAMALIVLARMDAAR